ncbi:hypothetical protein COO60DRAFT_1488009, partial [Scenedesmus sp. NREL 46B-D3]
MFGSEFTDDWREQHFTGDRKASLALWLYQHKADVTRLVVAAPYGSTSVWQLPLQTLLQLQHLRLHDCKLQALQADSDGGAHPAATAYAEQQQHSSAASSSSKNEVGCLSSLKKLTTLGLMVSLLPAGEAQPFKCLRQLQRLVLYSSPGVVGVHSSVLAGLPPSLTVLRLPWADQAPFSSSLAPAVASLTALQVLHVQATRGCGGAQLNICKSMPQLRKLWLEGRLGIDVVDLLDVLPHLPDLEDVSVSVYDRYVAPNLLQPLIDLSRFSGLLASTPRSTQLQFSWHRVCQLPIGCGQHLFAASVQLSCLKRLVLRTPRYADSAERIRLLCEADWSVGGV